MWHTKDIKEVKKNFKVDENYGLTDEEVKIRREKYGKNKLKDNKKESMIVRFIKQFNDFMIIILIISSIISAIVSKMDGSGDYIDSIIIIAIVILNAIMGLIQETKAEKSIEALKNMTAPMAKVKRNGNIITIKTEEIVPGDIIIIEAGDYIPADARLISSSALKVDESSLTGETIAVNKDETKILPEKIPLRRYGKYGICINSCCEWTCAGTCYKDSV